MSLSYAWEKFYVAVRNLVGRESIQERLYYAYSGSLVRLTPEDLPEDLQEEFRKLQERLESIGATDDKGNITASTRAMSSDEAEKLAKQIVSMFSSIARQYSW